MRRGRERRDDRRDDRGSGGSSKNRYQMRQKMVSIVFLDELWI